MKKILMLANSEGGLYIFRGLLIKELVKKGYQVTLGTPFTGRIGELRELGADIINIPVNRRGINPITDFKLYVTYSKLLKNIKPDIVITYTIKPNIYGGLACRMAKVPYIANITGLGTAFQKEGMLKRIVTLMNRIASKNASVVFFENEENRQFFINERIVDEEQTYRLNGAGVDLDRFSVLDYPDGDTIRFLFVGRVMKEKGIDELFAAMKKLVSEGEKVHLDVLGDFIEDYQVVIKQYEDEGWLTYHGFQADVKPFILNSHCYVLPSWHEGMANTNLECAASGRPVITSDISGCKEAVQNGVTGFLAKKRDVEDLYHVMKKFIMLSHEEQKEMGLAGRKRMEDIFDKKLVVSETIKKIMEILKDG